MAARHIAEVFKEARLAPWTKYSDAEIEQLAALRRLYQKHFHCVLEVVEPMKKDKGKAAKNIAAGAAVGAVAGGITGQVTSMATPGINLIPGVAGGQMMLGAGAGAVVGGGVMALREKARSTPDHPQEQLWRGDVEALLLVDKKGFPVLKESTAKEKLDNMGELVSSNSLAYNVNSVLLQIQRYIHHDRVSGVIKKLAFKENDPRCIFCMVIVEWLHKELIPCPEVDRESRLLGQLDSWIKFMKDISAHNVFSTAEAKADKGWATMDALLLNVDQQFQQMRFHIEAEVRERSIGEQLRGISNTGKTLVGRLFQFLTYVLCGDDRVPPFFSINAFYQTIKRPDLARYVRGSPHGRLLAEIAQTIEVQEYLDVWPEDNAEDPYSLSAPQDPKQAVIVEGLLFLIHRQKLPQDPDVDALVRLKAVAPMFNAERAILLSFIRLHVQLPVLTRLLLACKEAAFLAGAFGELMFLRNDNSRKILEFLIEGTLSICTAIKEDLDGLWQRASNTRRRQRVDNSGTADFERWEENWQQAYRIFNGMGTDNDIMQQLDQILRELTRVQAKLHNPAANLPQIKARMNQFVQLLDTVRATCPWLGVDDELKGLIREQACNLNATTHQRAAGLMPSANVPGKLQITDAKGSGLPSSGFVNRPGAGNLLKAWDRGNVATAAAAGPDEIDGTYTLEMALKESLQCEVQSRAKLEKELAAQQQLLAAKTDEWDQEKRRLRDHINRLTAERAQSACSFPEPIARGRNSAPRSPVRPPPHPGDSKQKGWNHTRSISGDGSDTASGDPILGHTAARAEEPTTRRSRSPMKEVGHQLKRAARSFSTGALGHGHTRRSTSTSVSPAL